VAGVRPRRSKPKLSHRTAGGGFDKLRARSTGCCPPAAVSTALLRAGVTRRPAATWATYRLPRRTRGYVPVTGGCAPWTPCLKWR
jgi:hypothetical protein